MIKTAEELHRAVQLIFYFSKENEKRFLRIVVLEDFLC